MYYVRAKRKYKITKNWRRYSEIYKLFGGDDPTLDYSEESAYESFVYESYGIGNFKFGLFNNPDGKYNGYIVGKHWMDVTVKMWVEDIRNGPILLRKELESEYPIWWLDRVLPKWK